MKETNLEKVREMAVVFLYVDIHPTQLPFVASHPFTNTWFATVKGLDELVDLHDEENADKWRVMKKDFIEKGDLIDIFLMMNKPYILNFLKFTERYISDDDLGMILGNFWQNIENISLDGSITNSKMIEMFKRAAKNKLMNKKELEKFNSLPDMITVYRGVTSYNKKKKKAFSWTTSREIAEWFANRFDTGTGEIWTLVVPKERILCAFDGREQELIVNLYRFNGEIKIEKV